MSAAESPWRVREVGRTYAGAPTFLLIHGYGASSFTWRGIETPLTSMGRVLTVDLVGYGDEDYPDDRCSPAVLADRLAEELVRRGAERVTLVGHSLGGGIALRLAQLLSEGATPGLERLVIVAGAAYAQDLPPFVALASHGRPAEVAFGLIDPRLLAAQVLRSIVYDPACISDDMIAGYARPLEDPSVRRALLAAARVIVPPDLDRMTAAYPSLDVPALVVWGRQDRVVPLWVGRKLAADLPEAELVVIERCGHAPMEERPEELRAAVMGFLRGTSSPRPPPR